MVVHMADRDEADREIRRARSAAYSACAAGASADEILAAVRDGISDAAAAADRTAAIMADADRVYEDWQARQQGPRHAAPADQVA
jgi:hypothetical protein